LLCSHTMSKTYYKCKLRGLSHGPGTDHRVSWNACSFFREKATPPPATGGSCEKREDPPATGQGEKS
jgi:hypothetical protein